MTQIDKTIIDQPPKVLGCCPHPSGVPWYHWALGANSRVQFPLVPSTSCCFLWIVSGTEPFLFTAISSPLQFPGWKPGPRENNSCTVQFNGARIWGRALKGRSDDRVIIVQILPSSAKAGLKRGEWEEDCSCQLVRADPRDVSAAFCPTSVSGTCVPRQASQCHPITSPSLKAELEPWSLPLQRAHHADVRQGPHTWGPCWLCCFHPSFLQERRAHRQSHSWRAQKYVCFFQKFLDFGSKNHGVEDVIVFWTMCCTAPVPTSKHPTPSCVLPISTFG